jgi:hypothetical protein
MPWRGGSAPAHELPPASLPAVTALVPASVRVQREHAPTKPLSKPAPSSSGDGMMLVPCVFPC